MVFKKTNLFCKKNLILQLTTLIVLHFFFIFAGLFPNPVSMAKDDDPLNTQKKEVYKYR